MAEKTEQTRKPNSSAGLRQVSYSCNEFTCVALFGVPLLWSVSFGCRQLDCAISCMSCNCRAVTACSMTLARASTLTCRLLRHLFAAWRVLLSCALINPSSGTFCCIRLHTSSRCCWVSCNFSAYARSRRSSRASFHGLAALFVMGPRSHSDKQTATGPWLDVR